MKDDNNVTVPFLVNGGDISDNHVPDAVISFDQGLA